MLFVRILCLKFSLPCLADPKRCCRGNPYSNTSISKEAWRIQMQGLWEVSTQSAGLQEASIFSTPSCLQCSTNAFSNANVDLYLAMKCLLLRNHSKFGFSSGSDIAVLYITVWLMLRDCWRIAERFCHCPGILWRRQHWPNTVPPNTRNRCWREIVFSVHHLTKTEFLWIVITNLLCYLSMFF
jgi:hypothetical protein